MMKLGNISENSDFKKYYKVVVSAGKPNIHNIIPGYLTSDHGVIGGYLSAFIQSGKNDYPVWVIDNIVFGIQDKSITPGYYGTIVSPDDGVPTPLSVIVWNEPIDCKVVGGYIPSKNYDFTSNKMNSYIKNGNAWRDNVNQSYTFDDFK